MFLKIFFLYFRGRLKSVKYATMCVDHLQRDEAHKLKVYTLGQYQCHTFIGNSQYFTLSKNGEFRNEYMCARVSPSSDKEVQMISCDGHGKDSAIKWEWIPLESETGTVTCTLAGAGVTPLRIGTETESYLHHYARY